MENNWTFGQRLGFGFAVTVAIAVAVGVVAIIALRNVVASKDRVIDVNAQRLIAAEKLKTNGEAKSAAARGYLLTGEERFLADLQRARGEFAAGLDSLNRSVTAQDERATLAAINAADASHRQRLNRAIDLYKSGAKVDAVLSFEREVDPAKRARESLISQYIAYEERLLKQARQRSTERSELATWLVIIIVMAAAIAATLAAATLTRRLASHIGSTVSEVQSSSAELQTAANQQATGAREHATAMSEISTTISELLATSRQIAESAQRVAHVSDNAAAAARTGESVVDRTNQSLDAIRRQIDSVVSHMLDLGRKSQQIGAVLDIVSELAEQTNILAINATIEAAGAGDAGKRFAVVADEIRKLADRVTGSTKEVRGLIDDVRGAVNTTVMATESGSKAVDAGTRQFAEVASSFKQIASMVETMRDAAREIELSTKQQTTAVEQVNVAIANVAQVTRDTETSSIQTLQTASQLADLSHGLLRLVQPAKAA